MNGFRNYQRIRITAHGSFPELNGRTATVVRRLMSTAHEAWVCVDGELEERFRCFPADDPRGNHIKVYDDEVEEVHEPNPKGAQKCQS